MFYRSAGYENFYGDFVDAFYKYPNYSTGDYSGYLRLAFSAPFTCDGDDGRFWDSVGTHVHPVPSTCFTLNVPGLAARLNATAFGRSGLLQSKSPIKVPVLYNILQKNSSSFRVGEESVYGFFFDIAPFTVVITLTYDGDKWVQSFVPPNFIFMTVENRDCLREIDLSETDLHTRFYVSYHYLFPFPDGGVLSDA